MPWSWVGAQQGLGTVSGLIKCTCGWKKHKSILTESGGCRESACHQRLFEAYQSLHNSVIGGIHVGVEREGAFSLAVVRRVALWCYDPVLIRVKQQANVSQLSLLGLKWSEIILKGDKMKVLNYTCHPKSLKLTYSSCFLHPSLVMPRLSEGEKMHVWVHTSIKVQKVLKPSWSKSLKSQLWWWDLKGSGTCCSLHCLKGILDSPLGFGAVRRAPLVAMGRPNAAETHLIGFEEGDHERLLVLRSTARHQPRQSGVPPLAYRGRQGEQN